MTDSNTLFEQFATIVRESPANCKNCKHNYADHFTEYCDDHLDYANPRFFDEMPDLDERYEQSASAV